MSVLPYHYYLTPEELLLRVAMTGNLALFDAAVATLSTDPRSIEIYERGELKERAYLLYELPLLGHEGMFRHLIMHYKFDLNVKVHDAAKRDAGYRSLIDTDAVYGQSLRHDDASRQRLTSVPYGDHDLRSWVAYNHRKLQEEVVTAQHRVRSLQQKLKLNERRVIPPPTTDQSLPEQRPEHMLEALFSAAGGKGASQSQRAQAEHQQLQHLLRTEIDQLDVIQARATGCGRCVNYLKTLTSTKG